LSPDTAIRRRAAEHRAQDRAERDRSGDYRIDIATREIGDAAGRRRRPRSLKFDVAEDTLMGKRKAVSIAGILSTAAPDAQQRGDQAGPYISARPKGTRRHAVEKRRDLVRDRDSLNEDAIKSPNPGDWSLLFRPRPRVAAPSSATPRPVGRRRRGSYRNDTDRMPASSTPVRAPSVVVTSVRSRTRMFVRPTSEGTARRYHKSRR